MINCLIIDDEQAAIDIIEAYIQNVPYFTLIATTTNPIEGLSIVNNKKIDLIFLDIQMPNITGVEFIKAIQGKCKVIFTTAYDKYAMDGFELEVIDYLLKPVPFARFLKAAQKAKDSIETNNAINPSFSNAVDFIVVQGDNKGKLIKIEINDIDFIEGMRNYVAIHCADKKILSLMNMKDLESNLSNQKFIRVHKSFIVPIANISSVDGNCLVLKRNAKTEIIIGSAYKQAFLDIMKSKMINY